VGEVYAYTYHQDVEVEARNRAHRGALLMETRPFGLEAMMKELEQEEKKLKVSKK